MHRQPTLPQQRHTHADRRSRSPVELRPVIPCACLDRRGSARPL